MCTLRNCELTSCVAIIFPVTAARVSSIWYQQREFFSDLKIKSQLVFEFTAVITLYSMTLTWQGRDIVDKFSSSNSFGSVSVEKKSSHDTKPNWMLLNPWSFNSQLQNFLKSFESFDFELKILGILKNIYINV